MKSKRINFFSDKKFYFKLKNLFNNKINELFLIVAIPRSGSTVLEKVLSGSKSISKDLHEPFMEFGRRKGKLAESYKKLINSIINLPKKNKKILIKEMSHDISLKKIFKKIIPLTYHTIIINIRNPFLCAESRIVSILKASPVSLRKSTKKFILKELKNKITIKHLKNLKTYFIMQLESIFQEKSILYNSEFESVLYEKLFNIVYGNKISQITNIHSCVVTPEKFK